MLASRSKYGRAPPPLDITKTQKRRIAFQMIDLDHVQTDSGVRARIYGTTMEGNSICCSVTGYVPYIYSAAPKEYSADKLSSYKHQLNESLKNMPAQVRSGIPANVDVFVPKIEEVRGASLMHYSEGNDQIFLKIFAISPKIFNQVRTSFCNITRQGLQFYEANIDFEIRFMADIGLVGGGWLEIVAGDYNLVTGRRETTCQLEVHTTIEKLRCHLPEEDPWSDIAKLRTLSFDVEVANRKGIFPEAQIDPIITIAAACKVHSEAESFIRVVFTLGTCSPVNNAEVIPCETEALLLRKFADFIRETDPDLITGYNIQNFDFPYIMDRAKLLKVEDEVACIGRISQSRARVRDATLSSAQMGTRTNKIIHIEGRIVFDVFQIVMRDYKLRSYTLNNVSYHFLGEQKEDVDHNVISDLFKGSDEDRRRLASYCMKDADLPLKLIDKLMLMVNYMEMARVTGVPLNFLITRGQQVKILSQLLRKARTLNYYLPVIERDSGAEGGYQGATVIEPKKGFFNQPIATLDFASLYPSIMIAHNLCYTTCMMRPPQDYVEGEDYVKTPSNNFFATAKRRRGLLPMILEDLLSARKKAKKDLKEATDPLKKMVLNGRQLALKISANSVYGFTGAVVGKLPCLEISQSVTAYGRQMIDQTKELVEKTYTAGNHGSTKDAVVIYGDTDSVMVDFGADSVAHAMEFGKHAAALISKTFPPPIKLEFEKVYCPYLLIQKKRYAGLYFTRPDRADKIDTKGLETVRRDNCPLVGKVMNSCLELLLIKRDPQQAIEYAKRVISELLRNQIDISMLIITKELTKTSENYHAKQAHAVLAERMRKRDPGSAPRLGDRVPYVMIQKGQKVFEKAEDPLYVLHNNIPIDCQFYLEHQLLNPLVRMFDPLTNGKAKTLLTTGEHARVRAQVISKTSGMGMFAKKVGETCLSCKSAIKESPAPPVCIHCEAKLTRIYTEKMDELRVAQHKFGRLWAQCQQCAGEYTSEVLCGAKDCPIFFMREKARVDLEEKTKVIRRFQWYDEHCRQEEKKKPRVKNEPMDTS